MKIAACLALGLACLSIPADAAAPKTKKPLTVDGLVKKAVKNGDDSKLPAVIAARTLGLAKKDYVSKALEAQPEEAQDGLHRLFSVLYEEVERGQPPVPVYLAWAVQDKELRELSSYLTDLDGKLKKATRLEARTDGEGDAGKGLGVVTNLELGSDEVKKAFKKELDFWFRGSGRKKKATSPPPKATQAVPSRW